MPTQVVMITSGALTVYGGLSLPLTITVGALGVFAGDLACYLLGRTAPDRRAPRHAMPGRARRAVARVTRGLREPGPLVILLCRFVPGGRMAACFSAGRSRYPYRLFVLYEATAATGWAAYGSLVGHLGGRALTESAWRLLVIGGGAAAGGAGGGGGGGGRGGGGGGGAGGGGGGWGGGGGGGGGRGGGGGGRGGGGG
ncbi:DedA family protein, partial [Micromonospora sp. MP36]|uniref:DedA family protein n=1 Tax=Micromonospora sp. MP36 TaxID=2604468 RepID=UPI00351AC4DD